MGNKMKIHTNITIEERLHKKAKEYAEDNGQTFSGLVSVLLRGEINN